MAKTTGRAPSLVALVVAGVLALAGCGAGSRVGTENATRVPCEYTAPDGRATRVSYGVLNLTHRYGHDAPAPLEPGKRYDLMILRSPYLDEPVGTPTYMHHATTRTFAPGEHVTYNVSLERFSPPC
jgi:hypothetical protein